MEKYYYKCFDCGGRYGMDEIEKELIYLCPSCGTVEKNKPLRGILSVEYDYRSISMSRSKEELLNLRPGKFWEYDYLWPLESEDGKIAGLDEDKLKLISLSENSIQKLNYNGFDFYILDDTLNPTLSFKDRASSLVALKAIQLGIREIAAASTGNAGSSLAGICARLGLKSKIFVPKGIPEAKRIQIQSYGAELVLVDGDYDLAFDTCLDLSSANRWYNRNTAYNPLTIEGKKSGAYDIFISLKGIIPSIIFIPTGDGVILAGLYKGFRELHQLGWIDEMPQFIAVQAAGANAFVRYRRSGKFEYSPAKSAADSICAGAPRALYPANDALVKTKGDAVEVTEAEILEAQKYAARNYGILIEPSSSAGFASFRKYADSGKLNGLNALCLFTGNGLKDLSALKNWNREIPPLNPDDLKIKYGVVGNSE
jgi:threonine synthase